MQKVIRKNGKSCTKPEKRKSGKITDSQLETGEKSYEEFKERHNKTTVPEKDLKTFSGDCFIGIEIILSLVKFNFICAYKS